MKIIAMDSSGLVASVAVIEDDVLIGEYNIQYKKTHSQTLLPMLDELKKMVELDLSTVDGIALAAGPGSFTGLRIGSATAKGLGLAMQVPLIEVPTLDGLACNLYGTDKLVCPIMDARRNQVYTGIYEFVSWKELGISNLEIQAAPKADSARSAKETDAETNRISYHLKTLLPQCALSIEEIAKRCNALGRKVIFLGDGVPVYGQKLQELMTVPYGFAPAHMNRQRASAFGFLAISLLKEGKTVEAKAHAPEYLRLSQAEREKKEALAQKKAGALHEKEENFPQKEDEA